jgi:hypothetical protein
MSLGLRTNHPSYGAERVRTWNVQRDGWLLFDLVGVVLQRVVWSDRLSLKTGGALPYLQEMPGCPRSRMKIILTTGVSGITGPVQSWSCGAAVGVVGS